MAVKVVVVARERVADAPLGEPFRVLTKDAALQVKSRTHSLNPQFL